MIPTVENIISVYRLASVEEYFAGINWYPEARKLALSLDPNNVNRAAGIIAAFSPQCPWWRNKELAIRMYETGIASGHTSTFKNKAQAIFDGADPLDILGGKKITNFYRNIVEPTGWAVTIDRHAFDIAIGRITGDEAKKALVRKGVYERFEDTYRAAASLLNLPAPSLQAVTWVRWRNEKGIPA